MREYQVLDSGNFVLFEFHALDDVAAKAKFVLIFSQVKEPLSLTRKSEPLYILATNCRKS